MTDFAGNIRALFEPNVAPLINIATARGNDGFYMAFLVKQNDIAKALSDNSRPIASDPRSTRAGAMMSLLEATEKQVYETLFQKSSRNNSKKSLSREDPNIVMPGGDRAPSDYGERPKERDRSSLNIWRSKPREKPYYNKNLSID